MSISKDLSLLSSSPEASKGRLIKESYSQTRSEFQRDRDRILPVSYTHLTLPTNREV